jgi:hypothetical protein
VTIVVFTLLPGAMALGMPIVHADRLPRRADVSARHLRLSDRRAEHHQRRGQLPLMAVPFCMLAGEVMNTVGLWRRIGRLACADHSDS